MAITEADLEHRFKYHPPKSHDEAERHDRIRQSCLQLAKIIVAETTISREQSLAITKLEEVMLWANSDIARNKV